MSAHFMFLPLSSVNTASSRADHFFCCFFGGCDDEERWLGFVAGPRFVLAGEAGVRLLLTKGAVCVWP